MKELSTVQTTKEIKNSLVTPFPSYVVLERSAGGKRNVSYVSGAAVIDKLNVTFGFAGWSWEIVNQFVEKSVPKVINVEWVNGKKVTLETPKYEEQLPVAHVTGKLTVHFEREDGTIHNVSKTAPGAQVITGGQSEQENIFKGAHTDALKKAATLFGIGLEMYRTPDEGYLFNELTYESPWTEEVTALNKENFEYLSSFRQKYGLNDDQMSSYINAFSNGSLPTIDYLLPDNIGPFVEYLKELSKATA